MNTSDLLKSLMDDSPAGSPAGEAAPPTSGAAGGSVDDKPASPYAMDVDQWGARRGRELLDDSESYAARCGAIADKQRADAEHIAADFHAAAYEPRPTLMSDEEPCADERRREYLRELLDSADYRALHRRTRLDRIAAELAAEKFAAGFADLLADDAEREKPDDADGDRDGDGDGDGDGGAAVAAAAADAADAAAAEVDEFDACQRGLGGSGSDAASAADAKKTLERFRAIKDNPSLRRIIDLAGRFRRLAQAQQRRRTSHGRDDVVGITQGGELEHILPQELAQLVDEDLALVAARRWIERGMLRREYCSHEPVGKGPVVCIVDESGSMSGEPIAAAKAMGLALAWVAQHQRRPAVLVGYSGDCEPNIVTLPAGGEWPQLELMEWLMHFWGGGSDMDVPIGQLPDLWPSLGMPEGQTDVLAITDGILDTASYTANVAAFHAWRRVNNVRMRGIVVGGQPGGIGDREMRVLCDEVWTQAAMAIEVDGAGVAEALSV